MGKVVTQKSRSSSKKLFKIQKNSWKLEFFRVTTKQVNLIQKITLTWVNSGSCQTKMAAPLNLSIEFAGSKTQWRRMCQGSFLGLGTSKIRATVQRKLQLEIQYAGTRYE